MQRRTDALTGLRSLVAGPDEVEAEAQPDLFTANPDATVRETLGDVPLAELDRDGLAAAMETWRERMAAHVGAGAACVHVSAGDGPGATLHALDFVPAVIARERERFGAHAVRTMGGNLLGDLVQEEVRRRERLVAYDDEAVVVAVYAPRGPYQLLLAPRRPVPRFEADGPLGAGALHDALTRLRRLLGDGAAPALWVRTAPRGADVFCWHIDVLPRTDRDALELGTGVPVCTVAPEQAAAELRAV